MSAHHARPALSGREGKLEIGPIPRFVKLFSRREAGGESDEDRTVSNPSTPSQRDDPRPQDISAVNSILPTQSLCTAALPPQIPMTWNAPAALARPYRAGRKNSNPAVLLLLAHCVLRTTSAATPSRRKAEKPLKDAPFQIFPRRAKGAAPVRGKRGAAPLTRAAK